MDYRKLGHSGAIVTAYCLGTMTFGAEADEASSHKLLDDYFAWGGNFIDTADVYSAGKSIGLTLGYVYPGIDDWIKLHGLVRQDAMKKKSIWRSCAAGASIAWQCPNQWRAISCACIAWAASRLCGLASCLPGSRPSSWW